MFINIEEEGGQCPVQIEGTIDGLPFYFRARGSQWSLSIAANEKSSPFDDTAWQYQEPYGESPFDAGWMELEEARAFLHKAANIWAENRPLS
jgi:hypothetical protein